MGEVFATTSGKGGVGKSTFSVGLAFAFCKLGKKVLLVDMDLGLKCLDLLLGVDDSTVFDLNDVLNGTPLEDAIYSLKENLFLLPASAEMFLPEKNSFSLFAKEAKERFDIVIFDFPAGIDFSLYSLLPKRTMFITVAIPDPVSIRDAAAVSNRLFELGLKSRLIINRFVVKKVKRAKQQGIDGIIDSAALRLLGIVPESKELNSLSIGHTIRKRDRSMKAFLRIANRLLGNNVPLPRLKKI